MELRSHVLAYLKEPFLLFDKQLVSKLAQIGWQYLAEEADISVTNYSIANCLIDNQNIVGKEAKPIPEEGIMLIEAPDFGLLDGFYTEHGLEPLVIQGLEEKQVKRKLQQSLALLSKFPDAYACVSELVRTVQILSQSDAEIDTSYSHPAIPFSIFFSICKDDSEISSLRLAESILHESMHLMLTLVERVMDLVQHNSVAYYYSPWRDEDRPIRGVLHGLFVFQAVRLFFIRLKEIDGLSEQANNYVKNRIKDITSEIQLLKHFGESPGLTDYGKMLVIKLLEFHENADNQQQQPSIQH